MSEVSNWKMVADKLQDKMTYDCLGDYTMCFALTKRKEQFAKCDRKQECREKYFSDCLKLMRM